MSPQDVTVVLNYTFDFCLYVTEKYLDNIHIMQLEK